MEIVLHKACKNGHQTKDKVLHVDVSSSDFTHGQVDQSSLGYFCIG